jgi:hypothetical protein
LAWSWTRRRRHILKLRDQVLQSCDAIIDSCKLQLAQRNLLTQPQEIALAFQEMGFRRLFWQVESAFRTSHSMWTLVKEIVCTVAMSEIVKSPGFLTSVALKDHVAID